MVRDPGKKVRDPRKKVGDPGKKVGDLRRAGALQLPARCSPAAHDGQGRMSLRD